MQLSECFIHPVKSCAAVACAQLEIEPRGPRHDRRYMVVDPEGRFLTGRKLPRMVLIRATPGDHGLTLDAPGMPTLHLPAPAPAGARTTVQVWGDKVSAVAMGAEAEAWLSGFLESDARLVWMDADAARALDPDRARPGDEVSFADGFPLLLIGQAALDGLNARLQAPLPMTRFRPNLVFSGGVAHAEDGWRRIRVGRVEFDVVKPCTRCVFTTVDPATGAVDPSGEPLATLKSYRRGERGITFGMNLIARGEGRVKVGDALEVIG
jgi:uncharacterized protein